MPLNNRTKGGSSFPLLAFVLLCLLAPLIFFFASSLHTSSDHNGISDVTSQQATKWREQKALHDLKSLFPKEVLDVIKSSTNDMGPLSLENFRNNLSASWRVVGSKTSNATHQLNNPETHLRQEVQKEKEGRSSGLPQWTDSPVRLARRQLIEKRMAKRAAELVQQDDEVIVKLEDLAIERSKSVDSAVLGKYNLWRKENENENADSTVRLMRDQIIMARVYLSIAKMKNKLELYQELQIRLKESQRALGEATSDADLHQSEHEKIKAMGQVLSKAKDQLYDCKLVIGKVRAMLQTADEQVRGLKKQSTFLSQLAAKTIPNGIHCLSMRLTIDYYLLPPEKRKFPMTENLVNPSLYHYALFSDNVLAASVVVNSTVVNAKDPSKHVFHLVTDKLNFGAMNMWFLLNPPGKATIYVENVDEFKWLNSSYCPVLRQLESATMKEYYFKAGHPSTTGASNLKYRNPKYLSMLNHLRFYLPQVYPKLDKILFLDDDIVVQKDLTGLWNVDLHGKVNGAVETCGESFHRFDKYLNFSNPHIAKNFDPNACGWAYGMNMFDLKVWKKKDITGIYHRWQNLNEDRVLWKLGTLPPGLMTFYGLTHPLNKSWHVLGLGYSPSIDRTEIENAAVVHYNGNMKPWLEIAMTKTEVRAAAAALRTVGDLPKHRFMAWQPDMDLLDWLRLLFGFQIDNARNQREHLVLHLSNAQMRLEPPPAILDALDAGVLQRFRRKLLHNYTSWCSYLGLKSSVITRRRDPTDLRRELLYVSLYLLIWGEAGNLRFVPECLCYIYHFMAKELNMVLDGFIDPDTGSPFLPTVSGEYGFLKSVVMPIYNTIKIEVDSSRNGKAPHSAWRNYDDINEYFWSRRCLKKLRWPLNFESSFFGTTPKDKRVGKTGYVEQRSFWNIYKSFDRLWVMLILFMQGAIIVAWEGTTYPWQALERKDVQVKMFTLFITWGGLRVLQSVLDAGTQYSLVTRETAWRGVRMVAKGLAAITWTVLFGVFYGLIWIEKGSKRNWSDAANQRIYTFLKIVFCFLLPEMLACVLFVLPCIRNFIEESDWRIVYWLTWWFHTRIFVGRGVRQGLMDNVKFSFFWIGVLAAKFSFSYFLQFKPLVAPTKALLKLRGINYRWHEFFNNTNRVAVVLLWLPVVLVYFMDLQIWYSIFSSFIGGTIGLFSHLGEIRNISQLRLRFQHFASAMQFNLMPEEKLLSQQATMLRKVRDAIHRLKLRYGLGQPFTKIESSQVDATRFALIWNEIIITFREEDIISDRELELLELPPNCWDIRVIRWPCFLLSNELLCALSQAKELENEPDRSLWLKMCKNEYRRCAVIEAYDSIKYLFCMILKVDKVEFSIVTNIFRDIDYYIQVGKLTEAYKMSLLPELHAKVTELVKISIQPDKDLNKAVNLLQALYELCIRRFSKVKKTAAQLIEEGLALQGPTTEGGLLFENAIEFPDAGDEVFARQLRRLSTILTSRDAMHNVPLNLEARRRIAFFSNSLFMNIPRAPYVEKMMAFSVLTPYYDEEVLYSKESLRKENEDGITTLFYLQKIYEDEWNNFMERMHREGLKDEDDIWTTKSLDLRLWVSYRGQTLSRTVRGMMYYYSALKMLAFLDSASEMDVRQGSEHITSYGSTNANNRLNTLRSDVHPSLRKLRRADSSVTLLFKGDEYGSAMMKFSYVVACQMYGRHKAEKNPRADDILYLMKNNEALRVAYVDEVSLGREETEYYSVLVKFDQQLQSEVEIFRVRLPGPLKLGEGKPENQNHAMIFTRGDAIQTIDMNQDNYFEEALKMRNLLEEFNVYHGIKKPTILGVRENIFTGSVSSLAWFMSSQETSFVTLGQRFLANPLKVRMHYGHPDVFDRFWFLCRGGVSKASRVINISEDIFAGFNCTLRGGNVTHHEYIQVGKGRDVGLNQISMFEAKVASGNGEQVLSRDVYRLGHRLDFFRMLSVFYTTIGFYFNSMVVVMTVYAFLWGRLYMALSGIEKEAQNNASNNKALGAIVDQQFIIQLGIFTALPMVVENTLEHGFLPAVWDFLTMQLQLGSLFFTFSLGTRTHFFGRTILHGGAKYRATGRGFVVEHKSFAENYRLYARSHFVKAIELGIILIVYASHSPLPKATFVYIAMTLSNWFLVVSWIMSPFVFNPSGFDWLKTVYDFEDFMNWIWYPGGPFKKAEYSWETWWYEEQDHLKTTGIWGKLLEIILDLRFFFFQYGIVYQLGIANHNTSIAVYLLSWIFMVAVVAIYISIAYARDKYGTNEHIYYRLVQLLVIMVTVLVIVLLLEFTRFSFVDLLTSSLAFIPTGWGMILIAQVLRPFLQSTVVWDTVVSLARLYDLLFGIIVMAPMAVFSWLPGFQSMQTRILFNEAFSRGLQISRIVSGKKSA